MRFFEHIQSEVGNRDILGKGGFYVLGYLHRIYSDDTSTLLALCCKPDTGMWKGFKSRFPVLFLQRVIWGFRYHVCFGRGSEMCISSRCGAMIFIGTPSEHSRLMGIQNTVHKWLFSLSRYSDGHVVVGETIKR